jgi:hypothetical protein
VLNCHCFLIFNVFVIVIVIVCRCFVQTEKALQTALAASQAEAAALRSSYNFTNSQYQDLLASFDALKVQLEEEGAFLVQRDKYRYRAAMKDLKDYAIYKEVMEAAMVRMQQELEAYAEENASIKAAKFQEEKQYKKQRE